MVFVDSHELRTPMACIIGLLDMLLMENLTVEHEGSVRQIHRCATSLVSLLNSALDIAKVCPFFLRALLFGSSYLVTVSADLEGSSLVILFRNAVVDIETTLFPSVLSRLENAGIRNKDVFSHVLTQRWCFLHRWNQES